MMESGASENGAERVTTSNKIGSQTASDIDNRMESFQDGGQHNTNSESADYSLQLGSSHINSDMNSYPPNSADQSMNSDNFNRMNDNMHPNAMQNYSSFSRGGFNSMNPVEHNHGVMNTNSAADFTNQSSQFPYSQGNIRPGYPSMGKPGLSPSRPGMGPPGMNMMSPPGPGYNQPPQRMMSGQSVSQQTGPTPTLNQLLQTSNSGPRFPNNYGDYPPGSKPGMEMGGGGGSMPYNMQQGWNPGQGRGMPSYPQGAMGGSSPFRNQVPNEMGQSRRQPAMGGGGVSSGGNYPTQGSGTFPNPQYSPGSRYNMMSNQNRPSQSNSSYQQQMHPQFNHSGGGGGGYNQSGPGPHPSGPPSSQPNPMYLSPQHSHSTNQSPTSHPPSQPGTPQSSVHQSPVHVSQPSPGPIQNSENSRSSSKPQNEESETNSRMDTSNQEESESQPESSPATSAHPPLSTLRRVPSPAGSTGSRSNTPASLPGNHPGSPMPPRPPSGQIDGQGRLTQSPMATQGFNQQIMPPPIGPNQGSYPGGPGNNKMGGNQMPGHYPQYNSQYQGAQQGNFGRNPNMPGLQNTGGMGGNYPPSQNMYNGPTHMGGNPMYNNMPRPPMANANYNNAYGQGNMGMPNHYGGYNNMGPGAGPGAGPGPGPNGPSMGNLRPGMNNLPMNDSTTPPTKGGNAAAAAAQAAMIAAANSAGNIRPGLNQSRMYNNPSGPIGQLNHMTVGLGAPPMNNMNQQPNNSNLVSNSASQNSASNASCTPKDSHAKLNSQPVTSASTTCPPGTNSSISQDSTANQNSLDNSGGMNCVNQSDISHPSKKVPHNAADMEKNMKGIVGSDSIGMDGCGKPPLHNETSHSLPSGGEHDQMSNSSDSMPANPNSTVVSQSINNTPIISQSMSQSNMSHNPPDSAPIMPNMNCVSMPTFPDEPPEKKKKKSGTIDLSKLYEMGGEMDRKMFLDKLLIFNEDKGTPITSMPAISKQPLDLYRLYHCVKERGGMTEVNKAKKWKEICTIVNIGSSASAAFTLKKNYIKYLFAFECQFDRGGMDPQPILAQMEAALAQKREQKNKRAPSPAGSQGSSQDAFRPPSTPNSQGLDPFSPGPGGMPPHYMQNDSGMNPMGGMMSHGGMMNPMNPHNSMMPPGHMGGMPHHGMMSGSNMMGGMGPNSMMGHGGNMPSNAMMGHGNMMRSNSMMGGNMPNTMGGHNAMGSNMPNSMGSSMPNSMGGHNSMSGNMSNSMGGPNAMGAPNSLGSNMPNSMGPGHMGNNMPYGGPGPNGGHMSGPMMPGGNMPHSMGGNMPGSMQNSSMPPSNMPNSSMPSNMPNSSMPSNMPNSSIPSNVASSMSNNMPPSNMPNSSMPNSSMPSNMPPTNSSGPGNMPPSNMPPSNMPNSSMPSNMPNSSMPNSTIPSNMPPSNSMPGMGSNMPHSSMGGNVPPSGVMSHMNSNTSMSSGIPQSGNMSSSMHPSNMGGHMPYPMGGHMPHSSMPGNMPPNASMHSGMPNSSMPGGMPNSSMPGGMPNSSMPGGIPGNMPPNSAMHGGMPNSSMSGAMPNTSMPGGMPNTMHGGMPNAMPSSMPNTSMPGGMPNSSMSGPMPGSIPNSTSNSSSSAPSSDVTTTSSSAMPANSGSMPHSIPNTSMPSSMMPGNMPNSSASGNTSMPSSVQNSSMSGSHTPSSSSVDTPASNAASNTASEASPTNTTATSEATSTTPSSVSTTQSVAAPQSMAANSESISVQDPFADDMSSSRSNMAAPPFSKMAPQGPGFSPRQGPNMPPFSSSSNDGMTRPPTQQDMGDPYRRPGGNMEGFPPNRPGDYNTANQYPGRPGAGNQFPFGQQFDRNDSRFESSAPGTPNQSMRPTGPMPTPQNNSYGGRYGNQSMPMRPTGPSEQYGSTPGYHGNNYGPRPMGNQEQYPGFQGSYPSPRPGMNREMYGTPNKRYPDMSGPARDGGQWSPIRYQQHSGSNYMGNMPPGAPGTPPMGQFGQTMMSRQTHARMKGMKQKASFPPSVTSQSKKDLLFPPDTIEGVQPLLVKRRRLTSKDLGPVEAWRLMMALKSGLLTESTWALDTLNILLFDDSTVCYFNLSHLPGLLDVLLEHFHKCLLEVFSDLKENEETGVVAAESEELKTSDQKLSSENYTLITRDGKTVRIEDESKDNWMVVPKCWDKTQNDLFPEDSWTNNSEKLSHIITKMESDSTNTLLSKLFSKHLVTHDDKRKVLEKDTVVCDTGTPCDRDDQLEKVDKNSDESILSDGSPDKPENEKCPKLHNNCIKSENDVEMETSDSEKVESSEKEVELQKEETDIRETEDQKEVKKENVEGEIKLEKEDAMEEEKEEPENEKKKIANGPISYHEPVTYPKTEVETMSLTAILNRPLVAGDLEEESYEYDTPPLHTTADVFEELARRCICISNIFRSLSCIPGNGLELSRHAGLMTTLGKLLLLHHKHLPRSRNHKFGDDYEMDETTDVGRDSEWWWSCLDALRENTLVIFANICGKLKLSEYPEHICYPILDGLLHWVVCCSSCARDPMPNMPPNSVLSPQRLVLEALCKLCIHEVNVDLLLATPPFERIVDLFETLVKLLANRKEQVTQEFAIVLLSELVNGEPSAARAIALQHQCISLLVDFLETAEQNAHQVAKSQGIGVLQNNPESMGTSLDMLRRAATILVQLARVEENRTLFVHQQSRLLALVMSQILDQTVAKILSDVLFECSQLS